MKGRKPFPSNGKDGRLNLRIDYDLYRAINVLCSKLDIAVARYIEELLRKQPEVGRELEALGR